MTLAEMFNQGMYLHLAFMAVIFVVMVFLINAIGGKKTAVDSTAAVSASISIDSKTGNMPAITAAITAAVKEYKKNN